MVYLFYLHCVKFNANINKVAMNICFSSNAQRRVNICANVTGIGPGVRLASRTPLQALLQHTGTHKNLLFPTATATEATSAFVVTSVVINLDPGQKYHGGFPW